VDKKVSWNPSLLDTVDTGVSHTHRCWCGNDDQDDPTPSKAQIVTPLWHYAIQQVIPSKPRSSWGRTKKKQYRVSTAEIPEESIDLDDVEDVWARQRMINLRVSRQ